MSIGGTIFFTSFILPGILGEFSRKYPQIKIELIEGTTSQLTDKLMGEELDLIIDNSELDDKNYEKHYYNTERIILAVPKEFEINKELKEYQLTSADIRNRLHRDDDFRLCLCLFLKNTPFIFVKEENSIYKRGVKMCDRQNYTPNITLKPGSGWYQPSIWPERESERHLSRMPWLKACPMRFRCVTIRWKNHWPYGRFIL